MNKKHIRAILALTSVTFSTTAMTHTLSDTEYRSIKKSIASDYQSDLSYCASYANSEKKLCMGVAKNNTKIALAALEARYHPTNHIEYTTKQPQGQAKSIAQTQRMDARLSNRSPDEIFLMPNPSTRNAPRFPVTQHGYL